MEMVDADVVARGIDSHSIVNRSREPVGLKGS